MHSISQILNIAFKVGCICLILLIPKATPNLGSSKEDTTSTNHFADSPAFREGVEKLSSSPAEDLGMGSEKNSSVENSSNFEKDSNDPFVQEITRVSSDDEDMIELNNLSRKKKFLWFQFSKNESGEARFRTLQGKNYNPYEFDEYDNLVANQYENNLTSKIGAKAKIEVRHSKPEASGPKIEENLKEQSNSDHEEDLQKPSSAANQQMPNELSISEDTKPAKLKSPEGETNVTESADGNDPVISDIQNSQITENESSESFTKPKPYTNMNQGDEKGLYKKVKIKNRGRKIEDSLMLEFAHNRPDSRILWLSYPDYRLTDKYRLIDEAAERTLITSREYGFVNTDVDSMKAAGGLITYVENNKIGYEVLNLQITKEWNYKSPEVRAEACEYLVNNNMMLRKYQFIYDSSQPPELIQAHNVTILLEIKEIQPRRLGALSCPAIQPNTLLAVTLFMSPITYVNEETDEYVFTFFEVDPVNHPLYVRLMFLSRLASGDSVEDEFVDNEKINEMDERWYGKLRDEDAKQTAEASKSDESIPKNDTPKDEFVDNEKINEMDKLWWYRKLKDENSKQTSEASKPDESIPKNDTSTAKK